MSMTTGDRQRTAGVSRPYPAWSVARWVALAVTVAALLAFALVGSQATTYAALQRGLAEGSVTKVVAVDALETIGVDGEMVDGAGFVRLEWSTGLGSYATTVVQASSEGQLADWRGVDPGSAEVVVGPIAEALSQHAPGVQVTHHDRMSSRHGVFTGTRAFLGALGLEGRWVALPLASYLLFLMVLVTSPEPRWATGWAWLWLALSPLGLYAAAAYLAAGARGEVPGQGRLFGGWAFVLMWVLTGYLASGAQPGL